MQSGQQQQRCWILQNEAECKWFGVCEGCPVNFSIEELVRLRGSAPVPDSTEPEGCWVVDGIDCLNLAGCRGCPIERAVEAAVEDRIYHVDC